MNKEYVFFWNGPFSQWYSSPFTVEGIKFSTAEQWMMYQKAMLFGDKAVAAKILNTTNPKEQKALGRQVRGFDAKVWNEKARDIVYDGSFYKYSQNLTLKDKLIRTGNKTLVEASPYDKIWGIGLDEATARKTPESEWQGTNWLGLELTRLRDDFNRGVHNWF